MLTVRILDMAKIKRICPFNHKSCAYCTFYSGRHCYTDFHRVRAGNRFDGSMPDLNKIPLLSLHRYGQGTEDNGKGKSKQLLIGIKLKITDMITEQTRIENLDSAKSWVWDNPDTQRFINGTVHITSWRQLIDYCRRKAKRGEKEIIIYEAPSYLLIGGG
jgi:hypothetical protein